MRKYRLLPHSLGVAAIACLIQSSVSSTALAGPMGHEPARELPISAIAPAGDAETAAAVAIAPAAAKPEPAHRGESGPAEPGERTRLVSYLILRGLQGAGPFLGR